MDVFLEEKQIKKKRTLDLYHIGVSSIKEELYSNLRLEKPDDGEEYQLGYCHFPEYGKDYFQGLVSEKCVTKVVNGKQRKTWEKIFERNEPLDTRVYARAAASLYGYDAMKPDKLKKMYLDVYHDTIKDKTQAIKDKEKTYRLKVRKGSFL